MNFDTSNHPEKIESVTIPKLWGNHYVEIDWFTPTKPHICCRQRFEGISFDEWYGRSSLFSIPSNIITKAAWNEFLERASPVIDKLRNHYEEKIDHNGKVRVQFKGFEENEDPTIEIYNIIETIDWFTDDNGHEWSLWDEAEWFYDHANQMIEADWTDEQIKEYLEEGRQVALSEHILLYEDFEETARNIRDEKRLQQEEVG